MTGKASSTGTEGPAQGPGAQGPGAQGPGAQGPGAQGPSAGSPGQVGLPEVRKIAQLSCLEISEAEANALTGQINSILGYMSSLERVDVSGVEAMSHVHGVTNVLRTDRVEPSLPVEALFSIVPERSGRFIKTPLVVDSE